MLGISIVNIYWAPATIFGGPNRGEGAERGCCRCHRRASGSTRRRPRTACPRRCPAPPPACSSSPVSIEPVGTPPRKKGPCNARQLSQTTCNKFYKSTSRTAHYRFERSTFCLKFDTSVLGKGFGIAAAHRCVHTPDLTIGRVLRRDVRQFECTGRIMQQTLDPPRCSHGR